MITDAIRMGPLQGALETGLALLTTTVSGLSNWPETKGSGTIDIVRTSLLACAIDAIRSMFSGKTSIVVEPPIEIDATA
jgi:hypothetical protein